MSQVALQFKINRSKCQILGIDCGKEKLYRRAGMIGCEVGSFPSSYFGLPLGGNPIAISFGTLPLRRLGRG